MAYTKITAIAAFCLILTLIVTGCRAKSESDVEMKAESKLKTMATDHKPVVAIIIDSLMDQTLQEALRQGKVPALKFLIDHGTYFPNVVSSFPTMSVTIDSTFLTGTYADGHRVPGLVWYSDREKRMIFYGNGIKEAMKIDQLQVLTDSVYQLNQIQLSKNVKTVHEELGESGKRSASINAIIFRGKTERDLRLPETMAKTSRLPDRYKVTVPELFSLAAFARLNPENDHHTALWEKYGMNDMFSARDIAYLVKGGQLPELTVAYFPENDNVHHRKGSGEIRGLGRVDRALQHVLNAYGSWDEAISKTTWIVLGDSAQSDVLKRRDEFKVDLRPLLSEYRIAKLDRPIGGDDQIVIAANERMAYIYSISPDLKIDEVVKRLQAEDKLDIIAAKREDSILITAGGQGENGLLYWPGGPYSDEYGQTWSLSGDHGIADISVQEHSIRYGKYPDVLARLYGALQSHEGQYAVVTVKPGYELVGESSPTHRGGGSHGSLHEVDSVVPLIAVGTDSRPKSLRTIDMKQWIMELAGR